MREKGLQSVCRTIRGVSGQTMQDYAYSLKWEGAEVGGVGGSWVKREKGSRGEEIGG